MIALIYATHDNGESSVSITCFAEFSSVTSSTDALVQGFKATSKTTTGVFGIQVDTFSAM